MKLNPILSCIAAAAITGGCMSDGEKESKITMDQVPAAVQQAIKGYASADEIKGIEDGDADGTKVIEFDVEKNGKASEIAFKPDGQLFGTEEDVAFADLPEAVQKTVNDLGAGAKIGDPEKAVQDGKVSYEVVIERDGKKTEFTFSPDGKKIGSEEAGKD
jgi:hypothetical protein